MTMLNHILNSKLLHFNVCHEIFTKNTIFTLTRGCFMASSGRPRGRKSATGTDIKHYISRLGPPGASGLAMITCRRAQPTPHFD